MSASEQLSVLAERKRLLVAQADLHRQMLRLERVWLQSRWVEGHDVLVRHRWWLLGGAALGGLLLARRWRGFSVTLPAIMSMLRVFR